MTVQRAIHAAAVAIVLALIAWQIGILGVTLAREGHLADAASYQAAVERWLSGSSPYSAAQLSGPHTLGSAVGGSGFVYPPMALPLFLPLALGVQATLAWVLLTHAAVVVVVFAIARRELGGLPIALSLLAVAVALALPGMAEIRLGNASALIATLIGLIWLVPRWAAAIAVLAGSIKVFPFLAVPWSLRWRASIAPAVVLGLVLIGVSLLSGPQRWVEWVTAMTTAVPSCPTWALPSLPCVTGGTLPGIVLAGLLLIGAMVAPSRAVGFLLLSVAMIVPAPDLYQHYLLVPFVGALPVACAAVLAIRDRLAERRGALPEVATL